MAVNCKTEIRKGTAYQSWDWDKPVGQGAEFKNLDLAPKGPWNTGLRGGDSKWQQDVWNCQPKVENFAEFELWKLRESDWIWIKTFYKDPLKLIEALKVYQKLVLGEIIKLGESLNLSIKLENFKDTTFVSESQWLFGNLKQADLISLTDSLKYIIIKNILNEEVFKLKETLSLNLTTSSFDSVKLSDSLLVDIFAGYGTLGYGESEYGD